AYLGVAHADQEIAADAVSRRQLARLDARRDEEEQVAPARVAVQEREQLLLRGRIDGVEIADEHGAALGHELAGRGAARRAELARRQPHERARTACEHVEEDRELLLPGAGLA